MVSGRLPQGGASPYGTGEVRPLRVIPEQYAELHPGSDASRWLIWSDRGSRKAGTDHHS